MGCYAAIMAEALRNLLDEVAVGQLGFHLARVLPGLDRHAFETEACAGLQVLELKARVQHLSAVLERHLQRVLADDFAAACDALESALAPPGTVPWGEAPRGPADPAAGLAGWVVWPLTDWVARCGLHQPDRALDALHAMTQRFTAEWAVRPFIERHPERTWARLAAWCEDPSEHVRRLASEGSRPRLPWGRQLQGLIRDPAPTLPLLARLQDDPSAYVRRSVANHLNDISRDHPEQLLRWLQAHLPQAPAPRRALLRHASRTLIKAGHAQVLAAWGQGEPLAGRATLTLRPGAIALGEAVELRVGLQSQAGSAQPLVIDYAVHHVKADGRTSPKVFKGWTLTLAPGEARVLVRRHALRAISTRRHHPGWHRVTLQVNGQTLAEAGFELLTGG